jgi:hypothetical protein
MSPMALAAFLENGEHDGACDKDAPGLPGTFGLSNAKQASIQ